MSVRKQYYESMLDFINCRRGQIYDEVILDELVSKLTELIAFEDKMDAATDSFMDGVDRVLGIKPTDNNADKGGVMSRLSCEGCEFNIGTKDKAICNDPVDYIDSSDGASCCRYRDTAILKDEAPIEVAKLHARVRELEDEQLDLGTEIDELRCALELAQAKIRKLTTLHSKGGAE